MTVEKWLPVPGYEGSYSVSSLGRVRSEERIVVRSDGVQQRVRERVLAPATCGRTGAFRKVQLAHRGRSRTGYVHRLVADVFGPEDRDG